jgi:hypothetical protein
MNTLMVKGMGGSQGVSRVSSGAVTLGLTSLPAFNRHNFGFVMRKNARAQKEMKIEYLNITPPLTGLTYGALNQPKNVHVHLQHGAGGWTGQCSHT